MSIASVLIPSDKPDGAVTSSSGPRYSLLLSTDPGLIEAAQRLRYDVFASTPGFTLPATGHRDVDRFDEYCDHLLVRDDDSGELVGCYRMLAPAGAIAAVVANAGAAVYVAGMVDSLAAGVKRARAAIADGSATAALERLRKALPRV